MEMLRTSQHVVFIRCHCNLVRYVKSPVICSLFGVLFTHREFLRNAVSIEAIGVTSKNNEDVSFNIVELFNSHWRSLLKGLLRSRHTRKISLGYIYLI